MTSTILFRGSVNVQLHVVYLLEFHLIWQQVAWSTGFGNNFLKKCFALLSSGIGVEITGVTRAEEDLLAPFIICLPLALVALNFSCRATPLN
jgi:hypothetical protein